MPYDKRQIIEVFFPLKDGDKKHPAVILSEPQVFVQEAYYICAMITSSKVRDQFSLVLNDGDTTKHFSKKSQVRIHLITQIFEEDIVKTMPINYMKVESFNRLIDHIDENVFGLPFSYV